MPQLSPAPHDDPEYAALLRRIRFNEYAAACVRSGWLTLISVELLRTAQVLVRASQDLRRTRRAATSE
jgi:hypothetical protein